MVWPQYPKGRRGRGAVTCGAVAATALVVLGCNVLAVASGHCDVLHPEAECPEPRAACWEDPGCATLLRRVMRAAGPEVSRAVNKTRARQKQKHKQNTNVNKASAVGSPLADYGSSNGSQHKENKL